MRFSSTAIIFQCASIFVKIVIGSSIDHIDEQSKSFDCDGIIVGHEQLSQKRDLIQRPLIGSNPMTFSKIYQEKYYEIVYLYQSPKNVRFKSSQRQNSTANSQLQPINMGDVLVSYDFFVLEDSERRACSILLQKMEQGKMLGRKYTGPLEYKLCTIRQST
ncbi:putative candidate secreted effector protein [Blumeria hordei DH14]|uniref:Putative candidate secreted effector protein n=1 Tax=Blumeria graminis f. sp. hordei (strain DH14) TaxID=546991 RepID=N1J7P9_BLUG1|nr:putative candidate secreted effector protein [Blumeria hordei DH14]